MRELLFQYADKFEMNFPIYAFNGMDEKEITEMIRQALETGKPVEPEYEKGATY